MAKTTSQTSTSKVAPLEPLIERLNTFSADNYWDLGKFLVEKIIPAALKQGLFAEQILKRLAEIPGFKFPYHMLKQCQMFYSYYPDVEKKPLPRSACFELATRKVDESKRRDHYPVRNGYQQQRDDFQTCKQKIRAGRALASQRTQAPDLALISSERNVWSFEARIPDLANRATGEDSRPGGGKCPLLLHQPGSCCYRSNGGKRDDRRCYRVGAALRRQEMPHVRR